MNGLQRLHDHSRDDLIPFARKLRPGILTERLIKVIFFLGTMEIGIVTLLATGDTAQKQVTSLAFGLLPIFLVSLFIGLKMAPFVLLIMVRRGIFGTIRLENGRLELPGGCIDLKRPFSYEARKWKSRIQRNTTNAFNKTSSGMLRTTRARDLVVFLGVVELVQDDTNHTLYCDIANDFDNISCENVAAFPKRMIGKPTGKFLRMYPGDLSALVPLLNVPEKRAGNREEGKARPAWFDPRRLFCPHLKFGTAVLMATLIAAIPPVFFLKGHVPLPIPESDLQTTERSESVVKDQSGTSQTRIEGAELSNQEEQHEEIPFMVSSLMEDLDSGSDLERRIAAAGLGTYGADAKAAIPKLEKALTDQNPGVREEAESSLKRIRKALKHNGVDQ